VWGDVGLAGELEEKAHSLRERFNRDFWNEERGTFLLALAGEGGTQRVDSVTSTPGQLLWSGIVDEKLAPRVVERLLRADLFAGWGIRTMSSEDLGFNPLKYHNGTVWPHDTALIAAGIARYGFGEEANTVARALLEAASGFGYRLPEVFAGFPRDETNVPVRYPAALVPQAWAAAAPLLCLRTLLGLDVSGSELHAAPIRDDLTLRRVPFRGSLVDVR
jgi:glycogen debranching enzyme